MAGIKVLAFFSLSIGFLTFASAKSNPGLWYEFEPRFQEAPVVPYAPQLPEGRFFGAVTNIALRKNYDSRLKKLLETVRTSNETAKDQRKDIETLLAKIELYDAKILKIQEKEKCEPKHDSGKDRPYESPVPIIIYTQGSSKGHYGSYKQPEPDHIYPVKGHYVETDYDPPKYEYHDMDTEYHPHKMEHYQKIYIYEKPKGHYEETDDYDKPKGHYGGSDDYDKPKGHYEQTNDYDKPKEHYEKSDDYDKPKEHYEKSDDYDKPKGHYGGSDDYDKPKGHYGKSETKTNGSSKKEDEKPIVSPTQKSSEGKSFVNMFDGYNGHAQPKGDFYTQYYPSRYRSGKELNSESKTVKESLKESSEKSSKEQKKS